MGFLVNKQTIREEIAALREHGYTVEESSPSFLDKKPMGYTIAPSGQNLGIIIAIDRCSYSKETHVTIVTCLDIKALKTFIKNFPKNIAPNIAQELETNPPELGSFINNIIIEKDISLSSNYPKITF